MVEGRRGVDVEEGLSALAWMPDASGKALLSFFLCGSRMQPLLVGYFSQNQLDETGFVIPRFDLRFPRLACGGWLVLRKSCTIVARSRLTTWVALGNYPKLSGVLSA